MIFKKYSLYFLLLISIAFLSVMFIEIITFLINQLIIYLILSTISFLVIIFLWYKFYQIKIKPHVTYQGLMLDTFSLVFGAVFGAVFSSVFQQPLMQLSNSGNYLNSFFAILLCFPLFFFAFMILLFIRIIYGLMVIDPKRL